MGKDKREIAEQIQWLEQRKDKTDEQLDQIDDLYEELDQED